MIKLENVYYSYGSNRILENINLCISSGDSILSGPNGCGKSTLLMLICGVMKPKRGSVEIDSNFDSGVHTFSLSTDVISPPNCFTASQIIELFNHYNEIDLDKQKRMIIGLDFNVFLNYTIGELSTGSKKKLSLITALSKKSSILLLDEPFNALDTESLAFMKNELCRDNRNKIIVDHTNSLNIKNIYNIK